MTAKINDGLTNMQRFMRNNPLARVSYAKKNQLYRETHREAIRVNQKRYYESHKAVLAEKAKLWHIKNKEKYFIKCRTPNYLYSLGIRLAKHRKLEWNILKSDFFELRTLLCTYCDDKLPDAGIGLDRIDNSKGYIYGNVVPCCTACNRVKSIYLTHDEMKAAMRAVKDVRLNKILNGVI